MTARKICWKTFQIIFILLLIFNCYVFAQNSVTLTFTGENQNHSYVRLEMVTIQNLSRGWSENIYFPDTIYTMNCGTGIEDVQQKGKMQVMPNPFDGRTRINVFSAQNEEVYLMIMDVNGRKYTEYSGLLVTGDNYFDISLTTPQTYIFFVKTYDGIHSLKMVNTGHAGSNSLTYASNTPKIVHVNIKSTSTHEFELGDEMKYIGYAQVGNSSIQSIPVYQAQYISEEITLSFAEHGISVKTDTVLCTNDTTFICYGTVNTYGQGVVHVGFCWDELPFPTIAGTHISSGMSEGFFISVITGINPFTSYYIRAYAMNGTDTVYGENIYYAPTIIGSNDTVFLPDGVDCGNGCAYESSVNVSNYSPSATIQSADDIRYVRAKLEHTYIGDIYIALTCPPDPVTGVRRSASILKKYGNSTSTDCTGYIPPNGYGWNASSTSAGTDFGAALHSDNSSNKCDPNLNPMGTPWNYCWSNNTSNGYQYANGQGYVYETANHNHHLSGSVDSSNMVTMTNIYHPDESFASLIGCPMNGTWSITVVDSWYGDNGWFTEWEMALNTKNSYGVVYTDTTTSSHPCQDITSVTDYDGNVYHTIAIGHQCWLRENMHTTHFPNGAIINIGNGANSSTACYYLPANSSADISMAGYLYNWKAAVNEENSTNINSNSIQGVCPTGWHVPSDAEWTELTNYVSNKEDYRCGGNVDYIAKTLAINTGWITSSSFCAVGNDMIINNATGFTAVPAGYTDGISMGYGVSAKFWSSTQYDNAYAYYRALNYNNAYVERSNNGDKSMGMSVRCLCDKTLAVTTDSVSNVSATTATCGGYATATGGATVLMHGVCWSTSQYPTINDSRTMDGIGAGGFTSHLTGLTPNTTYYVRAYVIGSTGLSYYGMQQSFTTPATLPVAITDTISNITMTSATCGGTVISDGGVPVTARGVCWGTSPNPTVSDNHTIDGSGTGLFTSNLINLQSGITYYVRAYATNGLGTYYGNQVIFVTLNVPTVMTSNVINILKTSVICGGNVICNAEDTASILAKGICWSTLQNPTISDSIILDTSAQTNYTCLLTNLIPNTTYYLRAYATNSLGTGYGNEVIFTTLSEDVQFCPGIPTVSDYDGNIYNTVQIGNQCWMMENLRVTHYSNGEYIPLSSSTSTSTAYRYLPNNSSSNVSSYGYLYNRKAMLGPSGIQDICPDGWHVPTDGEWTQLENYMSSQTQYQCDSTSSSIAKALSSTTGWNNSMQACAVGNNLSTNNMTGFSALPAGAFLAAGYGFFGNRCFFWSASANYINYHLYPYYRSFTYNLSSMHRDITNEFQGCSVRCLRD